MIARDYYSMVEAAGLLHGEEADWNIYQKIIKDLIHESANERLRLIVLLSGKQGKLDTNDDDTPPTEWVTIMDKYGFVPFKIMSLFESVCANKPLALQNVIMPLHVVHSYDNPIINCWELKEESPIMLSINTLHILTKDIKSYLDKKTLNQNGGNELPKIKSTLADTERTSLLKLALGMAIESYKYNPFSKTNTATGTKPGRSIKCAIEALGLTGDESTIKKYLEEASELLPDEKKEKLRQMADELSKNKTK